jgi:uncharacterized protein YlzI (FlbEa/FlbD family)
MIRLFRHDGREFMLNVDMIKDITEDPATVVTLINGERIQVKNTVIDVMTKIRAYRQGIEEENRECEPDKKKEERENKVSNP